ncbi:MAG: 2-C-methyl-D-erythritol 4-phosphate cytidylyltransferase [Deltaproteobacteria bacterium]|jgi:2-C-methyl-D-erythritol 4-phosphate cytidylyltransferase/2-C-methyl-D-erythritol 2,4-cyclodiphosphate synthase|nr:2-C-methyl-D-erythritol 4-phosphate cytidylyltransferase [Deltaproteobacteria bacterium]
MQKTAGAVVAAAGRGLRFGRGEALFKQLEPLGGTPVLLRAVAPFLSSSLISQVAVAVPPGHMELFALHLRPLDPSGERLLVVEGGASRGESVERAFRVLRKDLSFILVHDAARPLVRESLIERVLTRAFATGAAVPALRLSDTLKEEDADTGAVLRTLPREGLWLAQTPQAFKREILAEALAGPALKSATDEASLAEALSHPVSLVEGDGRNIKITHGEDLLTAAALLALKGPGEGGPPPLRPADALSPGSVSIGQGWDFHRFAPGRPLYLGCVPFAGETGLLGHSDADVLTHALIDALLGAAALGDIGSHFPDADPSYLGASGRRLLALAWEKCRGGFAIGHVDLTLFGERPRIAPKRELIRRTLCGILDIPLSRLNLKGKTTEGMGFLGRGEGLGAQAVALLHLRE